MPFDTASYILGQRNAGGGGGGGGDITVEELNVTENGTTTAPAGKAYSPVTVNVPNSYTAGDEGKVVSNSALVAQTAHAEVTSNGTIDTTLNNSVVVNVPNSYSAADEGKVVNNGALVAQTSTTVTENGIVDTTLNNSVVVNVPSGGNFASGSVTPASNTLSLSFDVSFQVKGFLVRSATNPYGTGVRTISLVAYDTTVSQPKSCINSNSSGSSASGGWNDTVTNISQTGNTVTMTSNNAGGGGYFISGITYNWFAW